MFFKSCVDKLVWHTNSILKFVLPLSDKYFISNTEKQENKGAKGGKDDTESNNAKGGKDDLEIKNAEGGDNPESEKTVRKLICKQLNKNIIDILDPLKTNKTTATENK